MILFDVLKLNVPPEYDWVEDTAASLVEKAALRSILPSKLIPPAAFNEYLTVKLPSISTSPSVLKPFGNVINEKSACAYASILLPSSLIMASSVSYHLNTSL